MRLLLVEDDPDVAFATERRLDGRGHETQIVGTGAAALEAVKRAAYDAILLDLGLPDGDGLHILDALMAIDAESQVIVLTGRDEASSAVRALRLGAADYVIKPAPGELLDHALEKVAEAGVRSRRLESLDRQARGGNFVGEAPAFRRALAQLRAAASSPRSPVLISGESGTGKEQAAARIHAWSERSAAPFVTANVAAMPSSLLEAELFGHEAGAFTGARTSRRGLFELASGGVLFLDEIGELQPETQPKLLRVIEGHPFRRLGGEREIRCDVRLVTATHKRLREEVAHGRFREDLYHRISVLEIHLPSLRERTADIQLLCDHFLGLLAHEIGCKPPLLGRDVLARLVAYAWPGNIRELKNVLERAMVLGRGAHISVGDLPSNVASPAVEKERDAHGGARPLDPARAEGGRGVSQAGDLLTLDEVLRRHVEFVVSACGGNVTHAAAALGISRGTLRRRRRSGTPGSPHSGTG